MIKKMGKLKWLQALLLGLLFVIFWGLVYLHQKPELMNDKLVIQQYTGIEMNGIENSKVTEKEVKERIEKIKEMEASILGKEKEDIQLEGDFLDKISGGCKTEKEFYEKTRSAMQESKEYVAKEEVTKLLEEKVLENTMIKDYQEEDLQVYKEQIKESHRRMADQGKMSLEEFQKTMLQCNTPEDYEKFLDIAARSQIKEDLVKKSIVEKENLTVSEDEYQKEVKHLEKIYGMSTEEVKKRIPEDYIRNYLQNQKYKDFLFKNALLENSKNNYHIKK